jgi:hypothetical protein
MFNTEEVPHVINPHAPQRVQTQSSAVEEVGKVTGPDLTSTQSWAELVMQPRSQS